MRRLTRPATVGGQWYREVSCGLMELGHAGDRSFIFSFRYPNPDRLLLRHLFRGAQYGYWKW